MGAHLPGAVSDVAQAVAHLALDAAGRRDLAAGHHAALQGAGEQGNGFPAGSDAPGQPGGLGEAVVGQRQLGTAAKTRRFDAFDMAVTREQDLGHLGASLRYTFRSGMEKASKAPMPVNAATITPHQGSSYRAASP